MSFRDNGRVILKKKARKSECEFVSDSGAKEVRKMEILIIVLIAVPVIFLAYKVFGY